MSGGKKNAIGDPNKPRLSLIPRSAIWGMAKAFTHGETKYGTFNYKEGIKITYLLDAAMRHITQFLDGENIDQDSQCLHLENAMAGLAMAIDMYYNKSEMDDRYKGEAVNDIVPKRKLLNADLVGKVNKQEIEDNEELAKLEAETRHFEYVAPPPKETYTVKYSTGGDIPSPSYGYIPDMSGFIHSNGKHSTVITPPFLSNTNCTCKGCKK